MAYRSRHRYIGRKRNERNKSKLSIFLFFVFVFVLILGSVRLGLYLKDKADRVDLDYGNDIMGSQNTEDESDRQLPLSDVPEKIEATHFSIEKLNSDNYLNVIKDTVADNSVLSITFRRLDGTLLYNSPAELALKGSSNTKLPTAAELLSALKEKGCYVSAVLCTSALGKGLSAPVTSSDPIAETDAESKATLEALEAFDAALVTELVSAGVDEVLLAGFDCSFEYADSICAFSMRLREKMPREIPLGLLMSYSTFEGNKDSELCHKYSEHFEILAVDYTDVKTDGDTEIETLISERINTMQLYFSRYGMRIIFDADMGRSDSIEAVLDGAAIYRSQYLSVFELLGDLYNNE